MLTALGLATAPILLSPEWPTALNLEIKENNLDASAVVLTTAVDVMVTTMISMRIFSIYKMTNFKDVSSTQVHASKYMNVVAMLVESAAPCAILGILVCVEAFINNSSNASLFGPCSAAIGQTWSMSIVSCLLYKKKGKTTKTCISDVVPTTYHLPGRRRKRLDGEDCSRVDTSKRFTSFRTPRNEHGDVGF
jgi:hypothetical protein